MCSTYLCQIAEVNDYIDQLNDGIIVCIILRTVEQNFYTWKSYYIHMQGKSYKQIYRKNS